MYYEGNACSDRNLCNWQVHIANSIENSHHYRQEYAHELNSGHRAGQPCSGLPCVLGRDGVVYVARNTRDIPRKRIPPNQPRSASDGTRTFSGETHGGFIDLPGFLDGDHQRLLAPSGNPHHPAVATRRPLRRCSHGLRRRRAARGADHRPGRLGARQGRVLLVGRRLRVRRRPVRRAGQHRQQPRGIPAQVLDRRALPAAPAPSALQEGARRLGADCRLSRSAPGGHRGSRLGCHSRDLRERRHDLQHRRPLRLLLCRREGRGVGRGPSYPTTLTHRIPGPSDPRSTRLHYRLPAHAPCGGHPALPRLDAAARGVSPDSRHLGRSRRLHHRDRRRRHRHRISEGPPGPDPGADCRVAHECRGRPGRGNHPQRGRNRTPSRRVRTDIRRHTPPSHLSRPVAAGPARGRGPAVLRTLRTRRHDLPPR